MRTARDLRMVVKQQSAIGQFATDSKGHIFRHELAHQRYFQLGGTEVSAARKVNTKELYKAIGRTDLPDYVSKYALRNEGEFYAEMIARRLDGQKLQPVVEKFMNDIERRIGKGIGKSVVGKPIIPVTPVKTKGVKIIVSDIPKDNFIKSLGKQFKYADLSDKELNSLKELQRGLYKSEVGGYTSIQNFVRFGQTETLGTKRPIESLTKYVKDLDTAISKSVLDQDSILLRGITNYQSMLGLDDVAKLKPGYIFIDKGYCSTTIDTKIIKRFTVGSVDKDPAVLIIHAKKGLNAIPIDSLVEKIGEKEILLPRNLKFSVTKITNRIIEGKKVKYIDVEII